MVAYQLRQTMMGVVIVTSVANMTSDMTTTWTTILTDVVLTAAMAVDAASSLIVIDTIETTGSSG